MAQSAAAEKRDVFTWLASLTIEQALYGLLFGGALAIRLARLGAWPLDERELATALAAWRSVSGSAWRPAFYSPLLYDVHLALFFLTRATEAAARLFPALAGAALVWGPYGLRRYLGRRGALVSAVLLAIAPTWVYFSRRADWPILTALATMGLLLAVERFQRTGESHAGRGAAMVLAAGLTAGPGLYTPLLALGILAAWAGLKRSSGLGQTLRTLARGLRKEHLAALGLAFLLLASAVTLNPGGIGVSLDGIGQWAGTLWRGVHQWPWYHALRNLALYEALTVILALVGVGRALHRRYPADGALLVWAGVALFLSVLLGHRGAEWLPNLLMPLVLLAGLGGEAIWQYVRSHWERPDAVMGAILIPPVCFAYLEVASYLYTGQEVALGFAAGAVLLGVLALLGYWLWAQRSSALMPGALLAMALLAIPMIRASTALAYQTGLDPREPMREGVAPSEEWRQFETFLTAYSARTAKDPHLLEIAYEESLGPAMAWALRDYPNAQPVPDVSLIEGKAALIAPALPHGVVIEGYWGQRFRAQAHWEPQSLTAREWLRWILWRDPVGTLTFDEFEVWVKAPTAE